MKYLRAFSVKYLAPTSNRGARVCIKDLHRGNEKVIIPYDYCHNRARDTAYLYLKKRGIVCNASCSGGEILDILLTKNFDLNLK